MSKKRKNLAQTQGGIQIESSYGVRLIKKGKRRVPVPFLQLLLLCCSVLSMMYCFITAIHIQVLPGRLIAGTIFLCVVFWAAMYNQKTAVTVVPSVLFAATLFLFEQKEQFLEGVYHLENYGVRELNQYYNMKLFTYIVAQEDGRSAVTLIFLLAALLLACITSYIIYTQRFRILYLILAIGVIAVPAAVGRVPEIVPLLLHVVCVGGMLGVFSTKYGNLRHPVNASRKSMRYIGFSIGAVCMLFIAGILGITSIGISEKNYEKLPIQEIRNNIQTKINSINTKSIRNNFNISNPFGEYVVGGLQGGKLDASNGTVHYNHSKQLKLQMIKPMEGLYLKGFTGMNYTKNAWTEADSEQESGYENILSGIAQGSFSNDNFSILNLCCMLADPEQALKVSVMPSDIRIDYVQANPKFLYYPYYTWFQKDMEGYDYSNVNAKEAFLYPKKNRDSYTLRYYNTMLPLDAIYNVIRNYRKISSSQMDAIIMDPVTREHLSQYEEYFQKEQEYLDYVYDNYLEVPDTELENLVDEFDYYKKQLSKDGDMRQRGVDIYQTIQFVKNYLVDHAEYTLAPGPTPENEDFIEYFIYVNHKGYCAHYASAATMMLRILGVPARYVEGYYVSKDTIEDAKIISDQAEQTDIYIPSQVVQMDRPEIEVTVDDTSAHSWVEVYIEGFGWYPVEFTEADAQNSNTEYGEADGEPTPTAEIAKKEEPTVTPEEPTVTPEEPTTVPTKEPTKAPENETKNPGQDSQNSTNDGAPGASPESGKIISNEHEQTEKNRIPLRAFLIMTLVLITIILLYVVHVYRGQYWRKYFRKHNISEIYIQWYRLIEHLRDASIPEEEFHHKLTYDTWKQDPSHYYGMSFEECSLLRDTYQKAVYSNHVLKREDLNKVKPLLKKMYHEIFMSKSKLLRVWYRYVVYIHF